MIVTVKNSCKHTLKELKQWMKPEKAGIPLVIFPSSGEIVSEPLGLVLIISPWNYPLSLALDPVIGAIAAGNTVVLKPSEIAPATSTFLAKHVEQYLDSSAVRVVEGGVPETSALLEQKWDKIFYTGNGRVGRIIMAAAAKHLTPVVLELGGKSPVIVDPDVDLKIEIFGLVQQFYEKDPLESKDLSRVVNSNHFDLLSKILDEQKVSGKIIHGGHRNRDQLKIAPTILLDVPEDSLIMNEEIFGPLLPILLVDRLEESFDLILSRPKPLAAYVFTNNQSLKEKFVLNITAGGIVINDIAVHFTAPTLPFGGVGESGIGAYHGKLSFDAFSHKKAVLYRGFKADAALRYPPYTAWNQSLLKALMSGSLVSIISLLFGWSKNTVAKPKVA
ncbi:hypothetical protein Droror1_Dr00005115 [Drosera rotundifolia]